MLEYLLQESAKLHHHLCPRQVLGVRMGIHAANSLYAPYPQEDKRLYTFVETDGCFADGVATATGCTLGHRTMRLVDLGKVAAVFLDTRTHKAIRIHPCLDIRQRVNQYVTSARSRWHTQLEAYQLMPLVEMFEVQTVILTLSMAEVISRSGVRVNCAECGEEIINEREVIKRDTILCRSCAGYDDYYVFQESPNKTTGVTIERVGQV